MLALTTYSGNVFPSTEIPKVPNNIRRNQPAFFFILYLHVIVTPSISTMRFSSEFIVLIILIISSFKKSKVINIRPLVIPAPFVAISPRRRTFL